MTAGSGRTPTLTPSRRSKARRWPPSSITHRTAESAVFAFHAGRLTAASGFSDGHLIAGSQPGPVLRRSAVICHGESLSVNVTGIDMYSPSQNALNTAPAKTRNFSRSLMRKLLLDQVVGTDYGQFDLVWTQDGGFDGDFDRVFAGQVNGLVGEIGRASCRERVL